MTSYRFSLAAQTDLNEIWDYTALRWGESQAQQYIRSIRDVCRELADGGKNGRPVSEIRAGYRKMAVARHLIFYRVSDVGSIDIVRILHQRMDVATHLPP